MQYQCALKILLGFCQNALAVWGSFLGFFGLASYSLRVFLNAGTIKETHACHGRCSSPSRVGSARENRMYVSVCLGTAPRCLLCAMLLPELVKQVLLQFSGDCSQGGPIGGVNLEVDNSRSCPVLSCGGA